ncbi:MAG TPA: IS21-like element helper ATPase IstB [Opitutales bacterium]|nr:IS21-like element helper ATPase IstB [Opitutales bacterium]
MLLEQTIEQLRELKLYGVIAALEQQINTIESHQLSFEERFSLLIDREIMDRGNRRITDLLRRARLRHLACIEDIDYQHPRGLDKSKMAALIRCDFIRHHQNLLITGPTGCGKSWLACAIGQQACRQRMTVRYIRMAKLLEELRISHADGTYIKLLNHLAKFELLILDDFGLDPLNRQDQLDLLELIEDRYQLKATLITSQLPIKHWHDYIGEPTIADAVIDRLISQSHQLELKLTGDSMRKDKKTNRT